MSFAFSLPPTILYYLFPHPARMPEFRGILGAAYIGTFEMSITYVMWLLALRLSENTARVAGLIFASPFISLMLIHFFVGEPDTGIDNSWTCFRGCRSSRPKLQVQPEILKSENVPGELDQYRYGYHTFPVIAPRSTVQNILAKPRCYCTIILNEVHLLCPSRLLPAGSRRSK